MFKKVDIYIFKETVSYFFLTFLLLTAVLVVHQLFLLAEVFFGRGVALSQFLYAFIFVVIPAAATTLPMAFLAGSVTALARLSVDYEIRAIEALGASPLRLLKPLMVLGAFIFIATFYLSFFAAPSSNAQLAGMITRAVLSRFDLDLKPMEINGTLPGTVVFFRQYESDKTLKDVFVSLTGQAGFSEIIVARSARIQPDYQSRSVRLICSQGQLLKKDRLQTDNFSLLEFSRLEKEINLTSLAEIASRQPEKNTREKDLAELFASRKNLRQQVKAFVQLAGKSASLSDSARNSLRRSLRLHEIEINKRLALATLGFVFAFLGLPLGLAAGRKGRTTGFLAGLAVIIIIYCLFLLAEKLAAEGKINVVLSMWLPVLLSLGFSVLLTCFIRKIDTSTLRTPRIIGKFQPGETTEKRVAETSRAKVRSGRRNPFRFINLIDRYLLRKTAFFFAFSLVAFFFFAVIAYFFVNLWTVTHLGKSFGMLFKYVLYRMPELLYYAVPFSVMAAIIISLGLLVKFNEITALKNSGQSLYRTLLPAVAISVFASGGVFMLQEYIMPATSWQAEKMWSLITDTPPPRSSLEVRNWGYDRERNCFIHGEYFDSTQKKLIQVSFYNIDPVNWKLERWVQADEASVEAGVLRLKNDFAVAFRLLDSDKLAMVRLPEIEKVDVDSRLLMTEDRDRWFALKELKQYVVELRTLGYKPVRAEVSLERRRAFPLACLVMTLLAIPAGLFIGKRGLVHGAAGSVALALLYWMVISVFNTLGLREVLPPFLAGWGANLIFGLTGLILTLRVRT